VPVADWSVRACQCAFCRAHGALTTSDPGGTLAFTARDQERVHRYKFGSGATVFTLSRVRRVCGRSIAGESRTLWRFEHARAAADPRSLPEPALMHYGDEPPELREERRKKRWTPLAMPTL